MPAAGWRGQVKVELTTCDLERHTFFCLEREIWIERTRERRGRGREALRIFCCKWTNCHFRKGEGGNRCLFFRVLFAFCFCFPERDGHKNGSIPQPGNAGFLLLLLLLLLLLHLACFFSLYSDSEGMVVFFSVL